MTKERCDENRTGWLILSSNRNALNGLAHGSVLAGLWCWLWGQGLLGPISWWPRWEDRQEVSVIGYFVHSIHVKTLIIHWTLLIIFSVLSLHRDTCRLVIRKIQFAPDNTGSGQKAELCKSFMMSDKPVFLEASLDKEVCNLWCTSSFDIYQIKKKLMCLFCSDNRSTTTAIPSQSLLRSRMRPTKLWKKSRLQVRLKGISNDSQNEYITKNVAYC